MPSTVMGLTNDDAPSRGVDPTGRIRHSAAAASRYWEYIEPPARATVLPIREASSGSGPTATTVPAPSLPAGIDKPTLAVMARKAPAGREATSTGRSGVPFLCTLVGSAPARS